MPISTKAKNAHPLASKIPMYLWSQGLESKFSVEAEKFEGKALEELERTDFRVKKDETLIAFLLSYSHLKPSERFSYAQKTLANDEAIISMSAALGHKDLISYFKNEEPARFNSLFNNYKDIIFFNAFSSGNLELVQWLKEEFPIEFKDLAESTFPLQFQMACLSGNLELVKWIQEQVSSESLIELIQINNYSAFNNAALTGNLELLKWFENQAPTQLTNMIKASITSMANASTSSSTIFTSGNVSILKWFKNHAPDELRAMISENYIKTLNNAVYSGELEMLQWCEEQVPDGIANASAEHNFYTPLITAFKFGDEEIINWFLSKSVYFAYAELHTQEHGKQVNSFVQTTLSSLHQASDNALINNPNEVFNIDDEEQARLYFYIIRNLIRRNDRTQDDELRFLLNIPSVKAMAHLDITRGCPNELLRTAMFVNNTLASMLLLNIETVRLEAERNHFYQQEIRHGVDLSQLALDRESSMTGLTTGEAKKLDSAILHYQPIIKKLTASFVIIILRLELYLRYEENPASIIDSEGETITLPLNYNDLQALKLNEADYKKALIAYYKHDDHTAWRYLSKPNLWMHPEAAYVYVDNADENRRWSTFDDEKALIALCYLAANDKKTEATEGHTLDTRFNHFIKELALIGRAHNWDTTRVRNGRREEFDNLEADMPSCFSGVRRRLLQSVVGHPLFDMLNEIKIENEIRQFAAWHFETILANENKEQVKKIIDGCYGLDGTFNTEHIEELRCFDIPKEKQNEFISYLTKKFGAQFIEDKEYKSQVHEALFLNPKDNDVYKQYHVLKLFNLTNFYDFLDKSYQIDKENETSEISEKSTKNQKYSVGFFQNKPQDNQPQEQDEKKNQPGSVTIL